MSNLEKVLSNKLVRDRILNFSVCGTVDLLLLSLISKAFHDLVLKNGGIIQSYRQLDETSSVGVTAFSTRRALTSYFGLRDIPGFLSVCI